MFALSHKTDAGGINRLFAAAAAEGPLKGIFGFEDRSPALGDVRTDPPPGAKPSAPERRSTSILSAPPVSMKAE